MTDPLRPRRSAVVACATHLPATLRTTAETEDRLRADNPRLTLPTGLLRRITGVESVHVAEPGTQASDLAVAAARQALRESPGDVDLLVFASGSQDLIEPATSHIVAERLGVGCAVFDVKNACNSVLNGMQVADALIATGQYRRALVVTGEMPSYAVRWRVDSREQFLRSFGGYTMSDGGAAVLLEALDAPAASDGHAPADDRGILGSRFLARSEHWGVGTIPAGGTVNPHSEGGAYFDMDGAALQAAFTSVGVGLVAETLASLGHGVDDLDFVALHQVARPYHDRIVEVLGVDRERTLLTVTEHGNLASATLPFQLAEARASGRVGPGSLVALVGLAAGISLGAMVIRL
ncbi:3-oxoacyl-ACP synthase [Cnuibacter physcomitrellae]|uniref:3-oxoacyl-ACP synthase n=1 Tax=Cnuibacter physcomitrellae TaxID=1619308 RepID=A0A1X9LMF3_9MICO|nr:ketoacyl-ACP synthase III [Cnuibacter physcomitrellae]ARJ05662.1 3-oxoacyl-ACP synthase [Cnuibacter physcomitrellae]